MNGARAAKLPSSEGPRVGFRNSGFELTRLNHVTHHAFLTVAIAVLFSVELATSHEGQVQIPGAGSKR